MKLPFPSALPYLLTLLIFVSANLDQELRRSIDTAMKCRFREPPKGPVMAVTPSKFVQVVVILHERFDTPTCFRPSKFPISVDDERSWPFCVFGKCYEGACKCAGNFAGPKCSTYSKKCWLMYCYLTSCHPSHQSMHCVCDPNLYGTKITTGIYWYDQGRSSRYIPPPPGWEDEPTSMIKLPGWEDEPIKLSDSAIDMGVRNYKPPSGPLGQNSDRGWNTRVSSGQNSNRGLVPAVRPGQRVSSPRQSMDGRKSGFRSDVQGSGASGSKSTHQKNTDENKKKEKTDVEEALEELDEVSSDQKLCTSDAYLLLFIVFMEQWIQRLHI